ncbi:MAG: ABC transporter permease [Anaerolineae bacterium]|nr:ABC transporter permease [Anaerolineae bacterium]
MSATSNTLPPANGSQDKAPPRRLSMSMTTNLSLLAIFAMMVLVFSLATPNFLKWENVVNIASTIAIVGIAAIGQTLVLVAGGVDISVGATAALTGVVTSVLLLEGGVNNIWVCAIIGLISGGLIGALNGFLVTRVKINPLITTLGTYSIARGLAFVLSGGQTNLLNDPGFQFIGRGSIAGVPFSLILMLALYVIFFLVLNHTAFGRNLYAIGGSRDAARLSGIRVNRHILATFVICGVLAAVSGLINVSQLGSSAPRSAVGLEFTVIAAVVLGGTSLSGGKGTLVGTLIGVIIMRTLDNGLVLLKVSSFYQDVARGLVLLFAVGFDQVRQRFGQRK